MKSLRIALCLALIITAVSVASFTRLEPLFAERI